MQTEHGGMTRDSLSPRRVGLYDPEFERDACGTGFVASIDGVPSRQIVQWAIQCVCNVTHRGAVSADAKTGDGAGVLTQIPHQFFAKVLGELKQSTPPPGDLAVGMVFLSSDATHFKQAQAIIEELVKKQGIGLIAWRAVPVHAEVLGDSAKESLPRIMQIFLKRPEAIQPEVFERALFLCRRRIEKRFEAAGLADCYIPSWSSKVIVYKGLLVGTQLEQFYTDLRDPLFTSAIGVFHQRYSTNTFPNWFLAQPFRFLAHNGEINTLRGNRNWMAAREPELSSPFWNKELKELFPIIQDNGSDSMSLDNVLELMLASGRDLLHAMMILVPDAWQGMAEMDPSLKAFYQYHALLMEPWDGPAALTFSDGSVVGACLDRNGLRPARYWVTDQRIVIMASEVGVVDVPAKHIVEKGRLGPGHIIAVDTVRKQLLRNDDVKKSYSQANPYAEWVEQSFQSMTQLAQGIAADDVAIDAPALLRQQTAFGYTDEELDMVLEPMVKTSKEAIWSMGDDAPLSVLSKKAKPLFTYFKQLFAQVTNPPIDPIREELVMSLNTILGARPNMLEEGPAPKRLLRIDSPLLLPHQFATLRRQASGDFKTATVAITFPAKNGAKGLRSAVTRVCQEAKRAVDGGATILILSDRAIDASTVPIPSLLATAAVHHHLIRAGVRMRASLVVEAGDVHEIHQVACLIGYGAAAFYPYLVVHTIKADVESGRLGALSFEQALANYRKAINQGLLKIMSKMGISTVGSYRGAQIFEALGLADELINDCFPGTPSRVGGCSYEQIVDELLSWHRAAFEASPTALEAGGFYKYRRDGEYHAFNPEMVRLLQQSIKGAGDYAIYKKFAEVVNNRTPTALRDLLDWKPLGPPVPLEEVESVDAICKRFATASISYGALSLEAHETIAIAMNRLGGKSGSGEGGEDPARYHPTDPMMNRNSAIKQIASGRFGVTPEYVMSARELEIKMAQGSKPGEGGQLPGHKVSNDIARVRHTVPGISLISPPPHHDIYSIEDLAQLIYDLKMVNPKARVCVKLVSEAGVGTIAAGVAKAHADTILISGHDGGTGASPLSSIKNAGLPWELGLAETQQTLRLNGLREKVLLRADGGMKTGRDIVMAALFGAEEYGFGTAAVVATGCVMTRQCHLNTCPVGVATQDPKLRARFSGTPEMVIHYLRFVAQEVREHLARLGVRRLEEIIGRTDMLTMRSHPQISEKAKTVNLQFLLQEINAGPRFHQRERNDWEHDEPLDDQILKDAKDAIERKTPIALKYRVRNCHRTVGARVAGVIATKYGDKGLPVGSVQVSLEGVAGQSFGAFTINGMRLILVGEANDYVGKVMAGGELIVRPPDDAGFVWHKNTIIGNTCLYGATGGYLYAAGRAGERFAVRNSGAIAVVEGLGDHGCEYMTGGVVLILGSTGRNFGAGMTGGRAYVLDQERVFEKRVNLELVRLEVLESAEDIENIRTLTERHFVATKSNRALDILTNWESYQGLFWVVIPRGTGAKLEQVVVAKEG